MAAPPMFDQQIGATMRFSGARLSTSGTIPKAQRFATIPVPSVVVKNLIVQARWRDNDRNLVAESVNLGPFSLAGHDIDAHSGKLSVRGMQVIAWVCKTMHKLPPNDPSDH
jgi:hypothetical protein